MVKTLHFHCRGAQVQSLVGELRSHMPHGAAKKKAITIIQFFFLKFLAVLGLSCCTQAFSSCGERGLLFIVVHGLLIAVASLVARRQALGMWTSVVAACRLSSCGTRA